MDEILLTHRDKSSLTDDIAGTRSQTTLRETRIGTDNNAPGTPQRPSSALHLRVLVRTRFTPTPAIRSFEQDIFEIVAHDDQGARID